MSQLLEQVVEAAKDESVKIEDVLHALGKRSYGPILLFTSLIELLPIIGAIPGMYIITASIIILLAGQLLMSRPEPWLPKRVRKVSFSRQKLVSAVKWAQPWAARLDRIIVPRLAIFLRPPFLQIFALISIVMALLFFPLAIIPASEKLLAVPVFVFGLALTVGDGFLALLSLLLTAGAIGVGIYYWPQLVQAFSFAWW